MPSQLIWRGVPDSIREHVYLYLRRRNDMRKDKRLSVVWDCLLSILWRDETSMLSGILVWKLTERKQRFTNRFLQKLGAQESGRNGLMRWDGRPGRVRWRCCCCYCFLSRFHVLNTCVQIEKDRLRTFPCRTCMLNQSQGPCSDKFVCVNNRLKLETTDLLEKCFMYQQVASGGQCSWWHFINYCPRVLPCSSAAVQPCIESIRFPQRRCAGWAIKFEGI